MLYWVMHLGQGLVLHSFVMPLLLLGTAALQLKLQHIPLLENLECHRNISALSHRHQQLLKMTAGRRLVVVPTFEATTEDIAVAAATGRI